MSNSLSSNLVLDTIGNRALTYLGNVFAPLGAFSTGFTDQVVYQQQQLRVPTVSAGATAQKNPTNWESGDTTMGNTNITVDQYSVSWQISPKEQNQGFLLNQLVDINLQVFGNKIMDVAMTPIGSTNWTNLIQSQATLTSTNLKSAWATIAKSGIKNLILDGTSMSQFLPATLTDRSILQNGGGIAGFDGAFLNTRWTGAGTNVYGFAGGPQCLGYVSGLPIMDDALKGALETSIIQIPLGKGGSINQPDTGTALTVLASTWVSLATRIRWASIDVMFGAAVLDNTVGVAFKSGGSA